MTPDIILEKKRLRREIRAQNRELDKGYIAESDTGIYENLLKLPEFHSATAIFTYYSIDTEPDTHRLIETALNMGKTVALPRCYEGGRMDAAVIKSLAEIVNGAYNIPAPPADAEVISPDEIDFAVIPALAYDKYGYRLGKGGGFYDRFLERAHFFSVGIVRSKFYLEAVPREGHDVRLVCIVTEKEIARLK